MNRTAIGELTYYRGRVALAAILKALGVGDGDEVLVQAFTCLAVPEGILAARAKPVYVDIEADGYNIDPKSLQSRITPRSRVIVVQHTFGIPAQMDRVMEIAASRDLLVVEDCCHTVASTYAGQLLGTFGAASFFSFEWGKPIVVGVGGSAWVHDKELRSRMEADYQHYHDPGRIRRIKLEVQYRAFGVLFRPRLYWPVRWIFRKLASLGVAEGNYHELSNESGLPEDFSMRIAPHLRKRLLRKLEDVDAYTRHAQWLAGQYRSRIRSSAVEHPAPPADSSAVYARYPLRATDKPLLLAKARKHNVELADWFRTPIHPLSPDDCRLVHYRPASCPRAEARANEIVSLPTHKRVGRRYVDRVAEFLNTVE